MSSQNCHLINQDTVMHQFFRNRYFMEFNCEGRQLSHPLEDFLTSHLLLSFLAVHSTVFTEYPLVPETIVLFSEGKPSLKKKSYITN